MYTFNKNKFFNCETYWTQINFTLYHLYQTFKPISICASPLKIVATKRAIIYSHLPYFKYTSEDSKFKLYILISLRRGNIGS